MRDATMPTAELQRRLNEFLGDSGCPAAALGVVVGDDVRTVVGGVLNLRTGVEATPDSVFQIGSITKVWTATQLLQLVDQKRVALDAPVTRYVPEFRLAEGDAAEAITVQHLLTHTSGIDGDVLDDVGAGDDCIERYVRALARQGTVHGLGETWSYCNSGWVLAGRVIEAVTGRIWNESLKVMLGEPLGLMQLCTTADEAVLHRCAVGHVPGGDGGLQVTPQWGLPRALGPAGLITTTATDLLAFARVHLDAGRSADGTPLLSPDSAALMRQTHVTLPPLSAAADAWGLGWRLKHCAEGLVIGHDGGTLGQSASLLLVPEQRFAIAVLTNSADGAQRAQALQREIVGECTGITLPAPPTANGATLASLGTPAGALTGSYRRHGCSLEVSATEDGALRLGATGDERVTAALGGNTAELRLLPLDAHDGFTRFLVEAPGGGGALAVFYGDDEGGRAKFLHVGGRAARRVPTLSG